MPSFKLSEIKYFSMDRGSKLILIMLVLFAIPSVTAQDSNNLTLDFTDGQTFGSSYVDSSVIVTPSNESGTFISRVFSFDDGRLESIRVNADLYNNRSSSNLTVETSVNEFESVRDAFKKEIKDGDQSYDVGDVDQEGSYRIIIESSNAVDVNFVTLNRQKTSRKLNYDLPLIGEGEISYSIPTIPYGPRIIASIVVFVFFTLATYWRRSILDNKIRRFKGLETQ